MTFGAELFESPSTCNSAGSCHCILPGEGNPDFLGTDFARCDVVWKFATPNFDVSSGWSSPLLWNCHFGACPIFRPSSLEHGLFPLIAPALAKVGGCGSSGSWSDQTCTAYRNSDLGGEGVAFSANTVAGTGQIQHITLPYWICGITIESLLNPWFCGWNPGSCFHSRPGTAWWKAAPCTQWLASNVPTTGEAPGIAKRHRPRDRDRSCAAMLKAGLAAWECEVQESQLYVCKYAYIYIERERGRERERERSRQISRKTGS